MGQEASRTAVEVLAQYMIHNVRCYHTGDASHDQVFVHSLREAANQYQANVAQKARENPDARGMTAAFAMYVGCWPRAYLLQVGATRCYRLRGGNLRQVISDDPVALGRTAGNEPNASGTVATATELAVPIVYRLDQSWDTVVLVCTEELSRHVSDEQIRERLSGITSAEQVCLDLIQDAHASGATDNITLIVGRVRPIVRQPI